MGWGGDVYMSKIIVHLHHFSRDGKKFVAKKSTRACTMVYKNIQGL